MIAPPLQPQRVVQNLPKQSNILGYIHSHSTLFDCVVRLIQSRTPKTQFIRPIMNLQPNYSVRLKPEFYDEFKIKYPQAKKFFDGETYSVRELYNGDGGVNDNFKIRGFALYWFQCKMFTVVIDTKQTPLRRQLNNELGKNHPHVATYAIRGTDNQGVVVTSTHVKDICHARLVSGYKWASVTDVALHVGNYFTTDHFTEEQESAYKEYISWVLCKSPWAMSFKTKHVWVATRYGIEMDVMVSHNIIAAAAIAIRLGSEYKDFSVNWKFFMKNGMTANQAFLAASFTNLITKNDKQEISFKFHMGGHHVVSTSQRFKGLVKFLENGYSKEEQAKKPFNNGSTRYSILGPISPEEPNGAGLVGAVLCSLPVYANTVGAWGAAINIKDIPAFVEQFKKVYNESI